MQRYTLQEEIGQGTFGTVFRAIKNDDTKLEVAIKKMKQKYHQWTKAISIRECQALLALTRELNSSDSEYIVQVYEILREKDSTLYFVCEYMTDGNLNDFITKIRKGQQEKARQEQQQRRGQQQLLSYQRQRCEEGKTSSSSSSSSSDYVVDYSSQFVLRPDSYDGVEDSIICSILWQVLQGLQYIHSRGYIHRDMKPENILMKGLQCKIADFSLARQQVIISTDKKNEDMDTKAKTKKHFQQQQQQQQQHHHHRHKMTSYVSTRWYRAPEIILCSPIYTTSVDIFAVGCIMAELYRLHPIFPGNGEIQQLYMILHLLGPISTNQDHVNQCGDGRCCCHWPEGQQLLQRFGIRNPDFTKMESKNKEKKKYNNANNNSLEESTTSSSSLSIINRIKFNVPQADMKAIHLLFDFLTLNPCMRPTAELAMGKSYFGSFNKRSKDKNAAAKKKTSTSTNAVMADVDDANVTSPGAAPGAATVPSSNLVVKRKVIQHETSNITTQQQQQQQPKQCQNETMTTTKTKTKKNYHESTDDDDDDDFNRGPTSSSRRMIMTTTGSSSMTKKRTMMTTMTTRMETTTMTTPQQQRRRYNNYSNNFYHHHCERTKAPAPIPATSTAPVPQQVSISPQLRNPIPNKFMYKHNNDVDVYHNQYYDNHDHDHRYQSDFSSLHLQQQQQQQQQQQNEQQRSKNNNNGSFRKRKCLIDAPHGFF